ncbi:hypothetical protein ACWG0P_05630 [Amedibacillus sp. YH-ame6]
MNKKRKYIVICTVLVSFLSVQVYPVHAAEGSSTTIVTAEFPEEDLYKLEVHVGEGGKVVKGDSVIENGIVIYQLSLDDDPSFTLVPNKGYKVKSAIYEKPLFNEVQDITQQIKNSVITIDTEGTEMKLYITFEKMNEEPEKPVEPEEPVVPERPDEDIEKPNVEQPKEEIKRPSTAITTGDQTKMRQYIALFGLTGIILILVVKRKKDEEKN